MTLCDKHRRELLDEDDGEEVLVVSSSWRSPRSRRYSDHHHQLRSCQSCHNDSCCCKRSCSRRRSHYYQYEEDSGSPPPASHSDQKKLKRSDSVANKSTTWFANRLYIMEEGEFQMQADEVGAEFHVNADVKSAFDKLGFILVRNLLTPKEVGKLKDCLETSEEIQSHAYGRNDSQGRQSKLCLWNYAGDDVTGVVSRSRKIAGTLESLLGGDEIYHYHSKLMMKEAHTGGAKLWHQDYGYWYNNGCLYPEMGTVFMPVDNCKKINGCLQVIPGSHKLGRIDHNLVGEQAGVDPGRLAEVQAVMPTVYVEMNPGDVLFFHCNTLHASSRNDSSYRRWAFIVSYNKRKNNPVKRHHHALYHPLEMLPNSAILQCNRTRSTKDKWFMHPDEDKSAKSMADKKG